jgi:hypothetical protein
MNDFREKMEGIRNVFLGDVNSEQTATGVVSYYGRDLIIPERYRGLHMTLYRTPNGNFSGLFFRPQLKPIFVHLKPVDGMVMYEGMKANVRAAEEVYVTPQDVVEMIGEKMQQAVNMMPEVAA